MLVGEDFELRCEIAGWMKALRRHDPCVYCGRMPNGKKRANSREHIVLRSEGGLNHWSNYAPSCLNCNHRRGNMPLLRWLTLLQRWRDGGMTKRQRKDQGFWYPPPNPKRLDTATPLCHTSGVFKGESE